MSRAPAATPPLMPPFAALESPVEVAEAVDIPLEVAEAVSVLLEVVEAVGVPLEIAEAVDNVADGAEGVSPNRFRITVSVLCQSTGMPLPQTISPDAGVTVVSGSDGSNGVLAAITATSLSGTPSAVL